MKYSAVCLGELLPQGLQENSCHRASVLNIAYYLRCLGGNPAILAFKKNEVSTNKIKKDTSYLIDFPKYIKDGFYKILNMYQEDPGNIQLNFIQVQNQGELQFSKVNNSHKRVVEKTPIFIFSGFSNSSPRHLKILYGLLECAKNKMYYLNLEFDHQKFIVCELFSSLSFLQLNLGELKIICEWFGKYRNELDGLRMLQDRFLIPNIVVTRGVNGAMLIKDGVIYSHSGYSGLEIHDPLNEDAFFAALVTKIFDGTSTASSLEFACGLMRLCDDKKFIPSISFLKDINEFTEVMPYKFSVSM